MQAQAAAQAQATAQAQAAQAAAMTTQGTAPAHQKSMTEDKLNEKAKKWQQLQTKR